MVNIGSLEIRASKYISAKLREKKRTYTYKSLQFSIEINTRGSKTLDNFYSFFTQSMICRSTVSINKA